MLILLIWLSNFLDKLSNVMSFTFKTAAFFFIILLIIKVFLFVEEVEERDFTLIQWFNKNVKKYILGLFLISLLHTVIPQKETYYAMLGVYAGQEIIANPQAQALIEKSVKAIEIKLDDVIKKEADKEETK